jgi:hypothetical protein
VAIEVPLSIAVAVVLLNQVDSIRTPGANRSTQLPKFVPPALVSVISMEPTVIAFVTLAGEMEQASAATPLFAVPLPARTQTVIPSAIAALSAASKLVDGESV